jgi:hypothetical protein
MSKFIVMTIGGGTTTPTPPTPTPPESIPPSVGSSHFEGKLAQRRADGTIVRQSIVDFNYVKCRRLVNKIGVLEFEMDGSDTVASNTLEFDQFEFWWRDLSLGIPWHIEDTFIFRDEDWRITDDSQEFWIAKCYSTWSLLNIRVNMWHSSKPLYTRFSGIPAETIGKSIVVANFDASVATVANGRYAEGDTSAMGFTIGPATDNAQGNVENFSITGGPMIGDLITKKLQPISGGDWGMVKTGDATYEVEFYPGQLGEDKSTGVNKVTFSRYKNTRRAREKVIRSRSATVVAVAGQGERDQREVETVFESGYDPSRHIETSVDARNVEIGDTSTLISEGNEKIEDSRIESDFTFEVRQTTSVFYGPAVSGKRTYTLGDLVEVVPRSGVPQTRQVTGVTIDYRKQPPRPVVSFKIETEEV